MLSRPQFSLRMLLFVVVTVCLAAATLSPTDYPAPGSLFRGLTIPETMSMAAHAQGALRVVMCVALPATLIAGALQPRRHQQTFCIGALFPALAGMTVVVLRCHFALDGLNKYLQAYGNRGILMSLDFLWKSLPQLRYELAIAWALAGGCGVIAVFGDEVLRVVDNGVREVRCVNWLRYILSLVLFTAAAASLVSLAAAKTPSGFAAVRTRELIMIALSMTLQGLLAVCAVQGRGFIKTFSVGALLVSCLGWAICCQALLQDAVNRGSPFEQIRAVIPHQYSFAAAWAFAPVFGLVCALLQWLFQRGESSPSKH